MIQKEPEFKSKELQNAILAKSSITELPKIIVMQNDILTQLRKYYAINDNNAYNQFELGTLQGNKKQNNGAELLINIFSAIRVYLTNLSGNESTPKSQIEKLVNNITNDIQLLFELSAPKEPVQKNTPPADTKSEIRALILGMLTKSL